MEEKPPWELGSSLFGEECEENGRERELGGGERERGVGDSVRTEEKRGYI